METKQPDIEHHDSKDEMQQTASEFEFCDMYELYNELQFGFKDKGFIDIRSESEFQALKMYESVNIAFETLGKSDCDGVILSSLQQVRSTRLEQQIKVLYIISNEQLSASNKHIEFCQYLCKLYKSNFKEAIPIIIMDNTFNEFAALFPFLCYVKPADRYFGTRYPSQIINDRLYLGNLESSIRKDMLRNLRITHIVNVSKNDHAYLYKDMSINYIQFSIEDWHSEPIEEHLAKAVSFIAEAMQKQQNPESRILVHCRAGVSRSASVIIAYLMKEKKMSYEEAYGYTKKRREIIEPNPGFVAKLKEFEQKLNSNSSGK